MCAIIAGVSSSLALKVLYVDIVTAMPPHHAELCLAAASILFLGLSPLDFRAESSSPCTRKASCSYILCRSS